MIKNGTITTPSSTTTPVSSFTTSTAIKKKFNFPKLSLSEATKDNDVVPVVAIQAPTNGLLVQAIDKLGNQFYYSHIKNRLGNDIQGLSAYSSDVVRSTSISLQKSIVENYLELQEIANEK